MDHESVEVLKKELSQVEEWEKEQKDLWFWEKLGRLPFALLDRITPKVVQDKIGLAIDELGSYIQTGGQYLINEKQVYRQFFPQQDHERDDLKLIRDLPLSRMDEIASGIIRSSVRTATVQGATTGIGGIFTLAIDIPLLLGLSLKALQEISLCYGYDPKERSERIFIVKCLQFTSSDIVGKKAIIEDLSSFHSGERSGQVMSQLEGWREVVFTYRDNFGWKKLFQMIPIAGILFGAFINRSTLHDVAETGMMMYRKRRIMERLKLYESTQIPSS
ncbi:EcsC family protein [Ammoniphilus sp. CFH 90114]|uniref:EcsC family protein n=1 Tax=Ammoniphilus sp. CFH 90114 TaxID=2493665 RepID=UPI00100E35C2|nr:EcsC family protein [Ammoniphilus sp. CFH 90114]RXT03870.1 EcsC family protein [Ammoniphilus sp. CFH 90114]